MKGDVRIQDPAGHNVVPTWKWQTEAGAGDLKAGEPCKLKVAGSPYVIRLADAEPVIGTTTAFVGVVAKDSTHTASADGVVEVYMPLPGVVYAAKAKTAASFDTDSEINALLGDNVLFDLTSNTFTVDQSAGNAVANGLFLVGGNASTKEAYFQVRLSAIEGPVPDAT